MITRSWFCRRWQWKVGACVASVGALSIGISNSSLGQIVPDTTLGRESSVVTPNVTIQGIESGSFAVAEGIRIDGGAIRGANLFHSFEQFDIGAGRGAYFTNPAGIENIFSRVTGASRSQILGRLGVLGTGNLFLINPKGIVFGVDSSLDVQGSFLATTADAVRFGDGGVFSASQPAESTLLSVSPSAFWFNAVAAQPIVNRSQSAFGQPNSAGRAPGLQVQPNRTIALIGGNVLVEGGRLTAPSGRIELGSVTGAGNVSLTGSGNRFAFGYDSIQNLGTIALSNGAFISASGASGGDIQIRGARLDMTQSGIRANTLGAQNGGTILIRTTETILREGSSLRADVAPTVTGTGGNITIDSDRVSVRNGSTVSTNTYGSGKSGRLQINAAESVEVSGESVDGDFSNLTSQSDASGDAGDITINTGRLIVRNGADVGTATFGTGKGGNLQINASELVEVTGRSSDGQFGSGLFAQSLASGNAGDLSISTGRLIVRDGSVVSTSTTRGTGKGGNLQINASELVELIGTSPDEERSSSLVTQSGGRASGDAGNLTIDTKRLIVRNGGGISVGTFGTGKGGNLQINASDSIELIGRSANGVIPSALVATRGSDANGATASGDAGSLTINTGSLLVRDRAVISSASFGNGNAGGISIIARDQVQANNGAIETSTIRSAGGAITITAKTIRLFGNSDIQSEVASGANNGGNITLTAASILAFNNSDILAFARNGRGGNITLNTLAFFGENYRPAPDGINPDTLDNNSRVDLNATGAISGIITIPDVSFIQNSLVELPENQINTDTLLANSCIVRRASFAQRSVRVTQGSFTITGTGGLPQRPGDAQTSSFPTVDVETLPNGNQPSAHQTWQKGDPITEPQGVYRLPNGKLVLSRNCR